jgi:cholesterol transport system auxiliary component
MARLLSLCALLALLAACASPQGKSDKLYDFGPLTPLTPAAAPATPGPAVIVPDVTGPAWLDDPTMLYRLNYADPLQARPYTNSRWASPPLQLLTQRIKARLAQAGVKVLDPTDAASGAPLLRVEVDDFAHNFDSTTRNSGAVTVRASLFRNHQLLDQKSFSHTTASASAVAGGGVRAVAASTDAVAADIRAWLAALPAASR